MPVINSVTSSRLSWSRRRRSSGSDMPTTPTRMANRIKGSTSPMRAVDWPTTAAKRFAGMNISTTTAKERPVCPACVATCFCAVPTYSVINRLFVSASMKPPGCSVFIMTRPSATPMAMLRKKKRKVRPASGPSFPGRPSCTTPVASEANTRGTITKNSRRRKIRPNGSSRTVAVLRIASSRLAEFAMPTCVSSDWSPAGKGTCGPMTKVRTPRMIPITSPRRMRFASLSEEEPAMRGRLKGAERFCNSNLDKTNFPLVWRAGVRSVGARCSMDTFLGITFESLVILLLVLANGFFVAAEFALVKVRASQLRPMAKKGGWRVKIALRAIDHLDAALSATQLGITLASLGLGWVGEPYLAHRLAPLMADWGITDPKMVASVSFAVAFAVITFLHIVFGELAPKSLAIQRSKSVSLWVAAPLMGFYYLFFPFIYVLNGTANLFLRWAGLGNVKEGGDGM